MPHSVSSDVPASLPPFEIPKSTDVVEVASRFVESLASQSLDNLEEGHFLQTAIWRDLFALTGTLRTFYTSPSIFAAWQEVTASNRAGSFKVFPASAHLIPVANGWIDVNFSFETNVAPAKTCSGMLSLVPDGNGKWVIWMLRTIWDGLKELEGLDVETLKPVKGSGSTNGHLNGSTNGVVNGHTNGDTNGHANGHANEHATSQGHDNTNGNTNGVTNGDKEETSYECVVVGGGQCGLTVAGRLKALDVKYVLLEKNEKIGDNWAKRYNSVKLHTIRDSAQLPFDNTFTEKDSEWLTKDDLARGYVAWTAKYGINVWTSTELISGTWDSETALWTLRIRQMSKEKTIQASNVVLANGSGGHVPLPIPKYSNKEIFKGTVMHSSEYKSPASWKGKYGIVIGTGNTAHDVTEDMVDAGLASTTMVQRGSTYVYPQAYYSKPSAALYSQLGTKNADTATRSTPLAVFSLMASHGNKAEQMKEPHRYDALEKAGFKLEREGDIVYHLFGRAGGHYMDVGASDKIAAGLIKMKSDALPISYTETGLLFSDGVELPADLIVFATGFVKNMRLSIIPIFGEKVANQMGDYWGLDEELEVKGAYKTCGHPALWYHGGDQSQARYYSKFVALQIKARLLGTPVKIYSETPKSVLKGR